jgi:hypothetical protein
MCTWLINVEMNWKNLTITCNQFSLINIKEICHIIAINILTVKTIIYLKGNLASQFLSTSCQQVTGKSEGKKQ